MCGFCNVRMCVHMGFVIVGVCMCGICNVRVSVNMGFVMCGCL